MDTHFDDVALPGLESYSDQEAPRRSIRRLARPAASMGLPRPTDAAIEAFQSRIVRAPGKGCWIWIGAISSPDGYGRITWHDNGVPFTLSAHRFALITDPDYMDDHGAPFVVEHRCNEPLCVRVGEGHIVSSSQADNMRYAVSIGRHIGPISATEKRISRVARSRAVREAVRGGWDEEAYLLAAGISDHVPGQQELF